MLRCKGKVLMPLTTAPRTVDFKQLDSYASSPPLAVLLKKGDGGPIEPSIVSTSAPGVQAELEEMRPGEAYRLHITLQPPLRPGRLRSWVKLRTGIQDVPEMTVPVYATVPPEWAQEL